MADAAVHDDPSSLDPNDPPYGAVVPASASAAVSDELKARLDKVIYSDVSAVIHIFL